MTNAVDPQMQPHAAAQFCRGKASHQGAKLADVTICGILLPPWGCIDGLAAVLINSMT